MARTRLRSGLIAVASLGLVASSLWGLPVAAEQTQDSTESSSASENPGTEPTPEPSPAPSPELSPTPSPAPSPSLTPSPDETTPSATPSTSPSTSSSQSASPSIAAEDGAVDDYIVVVRNGAYIDSIKEKAEQLGGQTDKELRGAVDGFTATLTDKDVEELEDDPNVKYIERDELVSINSGEFRTVTSKDVMGSLSSCDDCSSSAIDMGSMTVDWFGIQYERIYINSNGGAVFDDGFGGFNSYRGLDLTTANRPFILPLFTDLDPSTNGTVQFGTGQINDGATKNVFWAEWVNVAEYRNALARQTFQMLLIDNGDASTTVEFNYVTLTNAASTTNPSFEVGFADPRASGNTVVIQSGPSASTLLAGKSGSVAGRWSYPIAASGSPSPAPDPSPTPTPIDSIQPNAPWGLDRIDQRSLPLNSTYTAPSTGQGVTVYVVDTGIRTTHQEFAGRVVSGYDFVDGDADPSDCDGHGTHVAGTVMGSTYGVAKAAKVSGIRVLNCFGSGYTSDVIAGLNWIRTNHGSVGAGGPGVVNMSLGGYGYSKGMDDAVNALVNAGIPVVVAAGNSNDDASFFSPAGIEEAITVAATTTTDARASYSNYGSVVDVFAPGSGVISAWYTSNTASATLSGTSMASPHVAGAAALYLSLNPTATPAQVANAITTTATTNVVTNPGAGSPNRLLYISDFTATGGGTPPSSNPPTTSPPSSGGGSSGGGGSGGGGSSSDDSKAGGGGGGLNAISTIVPSTSAASGSTIALAGWGLETTRDVQFNDISVPFTVVSGRQVDVVVPDVPPGNYVIHAVLAPEVGRASFWDGFIVRERSAPAPAASTPPSAKTPANTSTESADFVLFGATSSNLSKATQAKLTRMANRSTGSDSQATIVAFTNAKGTAASIRRAQARAEKTQDFMQSAGFTGPIQIVTEPGSTKVQSRGALVYVQPAGTSAASANEDTVRSLIVRLKKSRSITVNGKVRGSSNVTGPIGDSLTVGPYLGLRMYRVDFAKPVSTAVAKRVAKQLMRDPGIEFAEPDSIVSTQVSITL